MILVKQSDVQHTSQGQARWTVNYLERLIAIYFMVLFSYAATRNGDWINNICKLIVRHEDKRLWQIGS